MEAIQNRNNNTEEEHQIATSEVNLPEIDPAYDYMKRLFFLSGQAISTGMGLCPLSWQELRAFRLENKLDITAWEIELIKKMSDAYCAEYSRASEPTRQAPYQPAILDEEENRKMVLDKALSIFSRLKTIKG